MNKRNGKIDILRFVFAIVIMLHHLGKRIPLFDFAGLSFRLVNTGGGYVVVFFFLTSGYLIVKSSKKVQCNKDLTSIAHATTTYLWKRYKGFLVWFLPAFVLNMIWDCMNYGLIEMLKHTFYNIPNLFMLQRIGFGYAEIYKNGYFVNAAWYLSALLICSMIIYPLLLWNKDFFNRILAPIMSIYGLYVLLNWFEYLRPVDALWYPFTVMCMGCIAYEISDLIRENEFINKHIVIVEVFEVSTYLLSVLYVCSDLPSAFEFPLTLVMLLAISVSFSGVTNRKVYDNDWMSFLGRASFPLYMLHEAIGINYIKIMEMFNVNYDLLTTRVVLYSLCISVALIAELVYERKTRKHA